MRHPLVDQLRERAASAPDSDADLMTAAANAMTAGLSAVDLHTPNGWRLSFVQRDVPGECVGCGAPGPVAAGEERIAVAGRALPTIGVEDLVDVQIDQGRSGDTLTLCGGCVAEGLAIVLGRRHVQHGGDVADLADAAGTRLGDPGDASPVDVTDACSYEGCAIAGPHYHRDTADGEEVVRTDAPPAESDLGVCPHCEKADHVARTRGVQTDVDAHDRGEPAAEFVCEVGPGGCGTQWNGVRRPT